MFWIKNWPFFKLRKKIVSWADSGLYPAENKMPKTINFSRTVWARIREIQNNTRADGSERAITVLDIDRLLLITPAIIGESERVVLRHKFKVEYKYEHQNNRCYRYIYRDDHLIVKDYFLSKKPPRKINLRILFNVHTHPGEEFSNFFSETDLQSFLAVKNIPATVLVAGHVWLLLKTSSSKESGFQFESKNPIKQAQEAGLVIYKGQIGQKLKKVS
jgi:hypothetical protein